MSSRPQEIDLEVAREYFDEHRALFIDARPALQYERCLERIPEAVHIDPDAGASLDHALHTLPRQRLLVAYCDEPAHAASASLARRARALGCGDATFMRGGLAGWKQAGMPTEVGRPPRAHRDQRHLAVRHTIEERHEGVDLTVWAPEAAQLFAEAARGLAEGLGFARSETDWRRHELSLAVPAARGARDHEALLITFLGELMTRSRHEARLFSQIFVRSLTPSRVEATVVGAEVANWRLSPFPRDLPEVHLQRHLHNNAPQLVGQVMIYRGHRGGR